MPSIQSEENSEDNLEEVSRKPRGPPIKNVYGNWYYAGLARRAKEFGLPGHYVNELQMLNMFAMITENPIVNDTNEINKMNATIDDTRVKVDNVCEHKKDNLAEMKRIYEF